MSIREESEECSISPLELFDTPPTQTAVEKSYDVEFLPTSAVRDGGVIEFYVPASTDDYLDLRNSRLHIKAKIVRASTNANLAALTSVAPINNLLQSMWSNVELMLNDRLVTHSNNVHGYVSTMAHLLHDSEEFLNSEGRMQMLYKDTASQLDSTDPKLSNPTHKIQRLNLKSTGEAANLVTAVNTDATGNHGLHQRFMLTHGSQSFEMLGGIRLDMFEQLRYLPSGISLKLRLHPQKSVFTLMSDDDDDADYKLRIESASFIIRKVKASPGVIVGHAEAMMHKPAVYPIVRKEVKSFSLPAGIAQFKQDNIFLGQLPSRVVIAMVDAQAFIGSFDSNPFNFQLFNANLVQLYADGEPVRSRPLRLGARSAQSCIECYNSLFRGMGRLDGDRGSIIKMEDWPRGYSLFAFNLAPDAHCDDHGSLIKHGNLRAEVQFSVALARAVQLLVYAEFDNIVKIDSDRQVLVDYV